MHLLHVAAGLRIKQRILLDLGTLVVAVISAECRAPRQSRQHEQHHGHHDPQAVPRLRPWPPPGWPLASQRRTGGTPLSVVP
ncbi:MAG: hypothetical protein ACK53Y_12925, partial [bacterium]